MLGIEMQIGIDLVSAFSLLEFIVPLALAIWWLNYFYQKLQEINRKVDAVLKEQDEIKRKLDGKE